MTSNTFLGIPIQGLTSNKKKRPMTVWNPGDLCRILLQTTPATTATETSNNNKRDSISRIDISALLCAKKSLGNNMARIYSIQLLSYSAGIPFTMPNCNSIPGLSRITLPDRGDEPYYPYISNGTTNPTNPSAIQEMFCKQDCQPMYATTCPRGLDLMVPRIREDLQWFGRAWLKANQTHSSTEHKHKNNNKSNKNNNKNDIDDIDLEDYIDDIDDVAIHFRCGDIFTKNTKEYGFPPFSLYSTLFDPSSVHTIGIITSSFSLTNCRALDCPHIHTCRIILQNLVQHIQESFPQSIINIRNGPQETLASSYVRLIFARVGMVCSSSTFCLFPAIANVGTGYVVKSDDLYPVANYMTKEKQQQQQQQEGEETDSSNLVLVDTPMLWVKDIKKQSLDTNGIIKWMKEN